MNNYTILKQVYNSAGVQLFLLPVNENIKHINKSIIPKTQLNDLNQYKIQFDTDKRLLARSFLYEFLNKYYAINNFELGFNEYLKPFFKMLPTIHFSFSYAQDYVFIAIGNSKIGIDIEYIDPKIPVIEIAPDIMCKNELDAFNSFPKKSHHQYNYFFQVFSAKESIIKAFGTGLHFDVKKINTVHHNQFIYSNEKFIQKMVDLEQEVYSFSICYHVEV